MPLARFFTTLNILIITFLVSSLILSPILIDKEHMADTVLLMDIAWRGLNGFHSVIDVPSAYGGALESAVVLTSSIFGFTFKSIDYAFIFMFTISSIVIICASVGRISKFNTVILLTLSAAIILSSSLIGMPLLGNPSEITVTHALSYNHVGIAILLAVAIFTLNEQENLIIEIFAALIIGIAIYYLALFKSTFFIIYFGLVASCAFQRRWISIMCVTAGIFIGMTLFDFGGTRLIESFKFLLSSSAAQGTGPSHRIIVLSYMLINVLIPISLTILALVYMLMLKSVNIRYTMAIILIFGAYVACVLTMAGSGLMLLPMLIAITISLSGKIKSPKFQNAAQAVTLTFAYSIILPACLVALYSLSLSIMNRNAILISSNTTPTPASTYFVYGNSTKDLKSIPDIEDRFDFALKNTLQKITTRAKLDESDKYIFLADGIRLLNKIKDIKSYGIVSNGTPFNFPSAIGSKVVNSMQLYPLEGLPLVKDRSRLGADADIVMISHDIRANLDYTDQLIAMMKDEFQFCASSKLWKMFVRKELHDKICHL